MNNRCTNPEIGKLLDSYLDGVLPAEDEAVMEAHLLECNSCYDRFVEGLKLESILASEKTEIVGNIEKVRNSAGLAERLSDTILKKLESLSEVFLPDPSPLLTLPVTRSSSGDHAKQPIVKLLENACTLYNEKRYRDALKGFSKLKAHRGLSPIIDFYIGLCHFELGEYEEAAVFLERVSHTIPASDEYKWYLANNLLRLGDVEKAALLFKKIAAAGGMYSEKAKSRLLGLTAIMENL